MDKEKTNPIITLETESTKFTVSCSNCGVLAINMLFPEATQLRYTHVCPDNTKAFIHKNIFNNKE